VGRIRSITIASGIRRKTAILDSPIRTLRTATHSHHLPASLHTSQLETRYLTSATHAIEGRPVSEIRRVRRRVQPRQLAPSDPPEDAKFALNPLIPLHTIGKDNDAGLAPLCRQVERFGLRSRSADRRENGEHTRASRRHGYYLLKGKVTSQIPKKNATPRIIVSQNPASHQRFLKKNFHTKDGQ
jgi:hypothetical protein